jgi:hypothetical protein
MDACHRVVRWQGKVRVKTECVTSRLSTQQVEGQWVLQFFTIYFILFNAVFKLSFKSFSSCGSPRHPHLEVDF